MSKLIFFNIFFGFLLPLKLFSNCYCNYLLHYFITITKSMKKNHLILFVSEFE